jgi:hypothetical protein
MSGTVLITGEDSVTGHPAAVKVTDNNLHTTPSSTGIQKVEGKVADGVTQTGVNPVLVGGRDNSGNAKTLATASSGQVVIIGAATIGDALANSAAFLPDTGNTNRSLYVYNARFNGSTWDRLRNNVEGTILASAARTETTNSSDQTNHNARGVVIAVDFTATPNNAETVTVAIQAKDPVSAKYVTLTAFTALTASALGASPTTETYLYTLCPGAAETAAVAKHEVQALALPRTWRVAVTHSAGGSWTYSVGYSLIV